MSNRGRLVRKRTLPGGILWDCEQPVPYVPEPDLGCSIFLYPSEADANAGANWGGSGFVLGTSSKADPTRVHLYAVTADHVASGCPIIRIVDRAGNPYVLPGKVADWYSHPDRDDVAMRPLGAVPHDMFWYVSQSQLLRRSDLDPEDCPNQIAPGDDCLMVGRYIDQRERQFDRPAVRFGNLSMLPEGVYQDERSFEQESFLVDMRSQSGYSGSPVFVYYEVEGWRYLPDLMEVSDTRDPVADSQARSDALAQRTRGRETSAVMGKTWLLGIDWGHLPVWGNVYDEGKKKVGRMRVSTGMAAVVPAWKILDLLVDEPIRRGRDMAEEELAEHPEGEASLDAAAPSDFARFENLMRNLVRVPKWEIDKLREG